MSQVCLSMRSLCRKVSEGLSCKFQFPLSLTISVATLFILFSIPQAWADTATLDQSSSKSFSKNPSTSRVTFSISNLGNWASQYTYALSTSKHSAGYEVAENTNAVITWSGISAGKCLKITKVEFKGTSASGYTSNNKGLDMYTSISGSSNKKTTTCKGYTDPQTLTIDNEDSFLKDIGNNGSITLQHGSTKMYVYSVVITYTIEDLPTFSFKGTGEVVSAVNGKAEGGTTEVSFDGTNFTSSTKTLSITGEKLSTSSALATVYFKASAATEYFFVGWYSDKDLTKLITKESDYNVDLTNSTSGSTTEKTIYANFDKSLTPEFNCANIKLNVGEVSTSPFSFNNTSSSTPSSDSNDNFYYVVNITNITDNTNGCPSNSEGKVISFDGETVTALNAGTATITFYQKEDNTNHIKQASTTITVTVLKYTPELSWTYSSFYYNNTYPNAYTLTAGDKDLIDQENVTSSDKDVAAINGTTITTYNVVGSTEITIPLKENYKWYSDSFKQTITPLKASNHVQIDYNQSHYNDGTFTTKKEAKGGTAWDVKGSAVKLIGKTGFPATEPGEFDWDDKYFVIHFDGIPDKLSFKYKTNNSNASNGATQLQKADWYIEESADGESWDAPIWTSTRCDASTWGTPDQPLQLEPTTRYLKFCYSGNFCGYFGDIHITELTQFAVDPTSLNFGEYGKDDGIFEQYIAFSHANAGNNVAVTSSSPAYVVEPTTIPNTGRDCMGTEYVKVSYVANTLGQHDADITFYDKRKNQSAVVHVTGTRTDKHVPVFTWNPDNEAYYYGSTINDIFTTTNNETEISIGYNPEGIATLSENENGSYSLSINSASSNASVTITITQAENDNWKEHTEQFTFTPRERPSLEVPFLLQQTDNWTSNDNSINWESAKEVHLGDENFEHWWNWAKKYIQFEFCGQPDSLFFDYRWTHGDATGSGWVAEESSDGSKWTQVWADNSSFTSTKSAKLALATGTRFVRLSYSSNFGGYISNIRVSAYDGIYYLKTVINGQTKYVSRGGNNGTTAVVDDYGIALRKTRYTDDNTNKYTRLQYIDQYYRNKKYLAISETNLITNGLFSANINFRETPSGKGLPLTSIGIDNNDFNTLNTNGSTTWIFEPYREHADQMQALKDEQAQTAANEFNVDVPTVALLRQQLLDNDYEKDTIDLTGKNIGTTSELYQKFSNKNSTDEGNSSVSPVSFTIQVKEGFYCVSLKAFYRITDNKDTYDAHNAGFENPVAYVYAKSKDNEQHTQICSSFDFCSLYDRAKDKNATNTNGDWYDYNPQYLKYYPNSLRGSKEVFNDNSKYENDVFIYVKANGDDGMGPLTYGFYSPSNGECDNWLCYHDFTITRYYRKEFVFDNNKGAGDGKWETLTNWTYASTPLTDHDKLPTVVNKVLLEASVTINENAYAYNLDGTDNYSVTIAPGASLTIGKGGIIQETTADKLILQADKDNGSGSLRLYPGTTAPCATVQMYSKAYWANDGSSYAAWQYIGSPVTTKTVDIALNLFYNCWLYQYTDNHYWDDAGKYHHMANWKGYAFTQDKYGQEGHTFQFSGQLVPANDQELSLTIANSDNENVLANSWTAPIDVTQFDITDFKNCEPTIYIYNTGNANSVTKGNDAGQYTSIAPFTAEYTGHDIIPAMQGFIVKASSSTDAKLVLDYKRLIWEASKPVNGPLKAPRKETSDLSHRACIHLLSADSLSDHLYLIEKDDSAYTADYDAGYDAPKYIIGGMPSIYAILPDGRYAVSATDDMIGSIIGINTQSATSYTLWFDKLVGEGLALRDLKTNAVVPITEESIYTFSETPDSSNIARFVVEEYIPEETDPGIATGMDELESDVRIWANRDYLYISGAKYDDTLLLYDAQGQLIIRERFHEATSVSLEGLIPGIYVARVGNTVAKIIH